MLLEASRGVSELHMAMELAESKISPHDSRCIPRELLERSGVD